MKFYLLGIDFVAYDESKLLFYSCSSSAQHAHAKTLTGDDAKYYIDYMDENLVKTPISQKCFQRHFSKAVEVLQNKTPFA